MSAQLTPRPAPQPSVTAIILAGGLSSRMGEDKALIEIDGLPLLLRVGQVAQQLADQVYVVTAWAERYQHLCAEAGMQLIPEPLTDHLPQGAVCGFLQGMAQMQLAQPLEQRPPEQRPPDWLLLLACDLPNLQVEVLRAWRLLLAETPADVMALLPQSEGWWEPLCGFYRRECQASLQAFATAGGRSFQTWLAQQSVQALPNCDPAMLLNCNTPADLAKIKLG